MLRFKTANWILLEARRALCMHASSAYFCFRTEARKCEGILFPRSHPQQLCFAAWSFEFPTWQKNCQYSPITLSFFSLTWLREQEEEEAAALMPRLEFGISFCKPQIWEGTLRFNPRCLLLRRGKAVHLKCALACSRSLSSLPRTHLPKKE